MSLTDSKTPALEKKSRPSHAMDFSKGFFVKLFLMLVVDAFLVFLLMLAWEAEEIGVLVGIALVFVAVNWVYFAPGARLIPAKYLVPGLVFLSIFQVFVIFYTGAVAFTNYGEGHNSNKKDAIEAILMQNVERIPDSGTVPLAVVRDGADLGFAIIKDDQVLVGIADEVFEPVEGAEVTDGRIVSVPGVEMLTLVQVSEVQREVFNLRVKLTDDPMGGFVGTQDARNGFLYRSTMVWDADANTMTNAAGKVFTPNDRGQFQAEDGTTLRVGWKVFIGFENFTTAFTDSRYAGPFWQVLIWNFAFAFLSVATTFLLGLGLAMLLNNARLQGKKVYRTLMILPYAFPSFMTALLFAGMMNRRFGFINVVFFGGAEIPWLTDPWLARLSLILVNLWMGFPYMFLVTTGALQSIPGDMIEAAKIDGATKSRIWRSVTMPLLFIAVAPLLIASFAFNFNNFALIKMLTDGGPRMEGASVPIGHTDILISMVYNISGLDGTAPRNYGLASALSIVIFLIVATISMLSFRRTQKLEDIN